MKEAFISVVKDYLSKENTDYALMINGAWGSGKTYFIDHEIKQVIESFPLPNQKDGKQYRFVPVSLYGVSSRQEISDAIFYSLKPELKWIRAISSRFVSATELIPKAGSAIKQILTVNNKEKNELQKLFCSFNDRVVIFDDLERIDKSLDIQSVLGYINNLAEREHCKIIVVSNDDVLSKEYKGFKEKTIRFTYNHQPNLIEILDNITKAQKDSSYKSFLSVKSADIVRVFNAGKCKNIRTLYFVIELFHKIFERVSGEYSEAICQDLLTPFTIISIEAKNGHSKEELEMLLPSIQSFSTLFKDGKIDIDTDSSSEQATPKEMDSAAQKREKYREFLKSQYGTIGRNINLYDKLYNWVFDGYVSEEEFKTLIEGIRGEYKKKELSAEARLVQIIARWNQLQDDEFDAIVEEINNAIRHEKFNVFDILRIYASFVQIDAVHIDGFNLSETDVNMFKVAIEHAMNGLPYDQYFGTHVPTWDINDTSGAKEKYNKLLNYAIVINERHKDELRENQHNDVLSMIRTNDVDKFKLFISNFSNRSVLKDISPIKLIDAIIAANAQTREWFDFCISEFYPENLTNPAPDDLESLERIKQPLDAYLESLPSRKVSTINLINLQSKINRTIDNYRKRLGMV